MRAIHLSIRQIGKFQGVVIPKPVLAQLGLDAKAGLEMTIADGALVTRDEIWLVNPDPTAGCEIRKTRPLMVVSPSEMHDHLRTVLVAPMTTAGREAPFRTAIHHGGRKGLILLDPVRAVDKTRLMKKLGAVSPKTLSAALRTLQEVFAE